ncbi:MULTISPECIES: DUF3240 family protein [Alteromonadaceae]|uniref:DUF3240 family protein n=1 Tax=Alteromonadaceae TaxID=72275 RepID=UPI001C0902A5|nr:MULTISPECIES: DUF3240 family protein [Aliiglaciecola]MBU2880101.1 DUF3240 family protein [Aliiglaciecola lipolytica]MDO6710901.1 DUF3240 family protein [Aliiglaciecola sp. 2_MG-2023]MDO6752382.1 DUF3240 family protein [Aliiglaciecola sp. 1_MG-2023]
MQKQNNIQLLIAIVPQQLKDNLVDTLIGLEALSGFSLSKIQGYSRENHQYNIQEQVEGYRDFYRFELLHNPAHYQELLAHIKQVCANSHIRFWCVPVIDGGTL